MATPTSLSTAVFPGVGLQERCSYCPLYTHRAVDTTALHHAEMVPAHLDLEGGIVNLMKARLDYDHNSTMQRSRFTLLEETTPSWRAQVEVILFETYTNGAGGRLLRAGTPRRSRRLNAAAAPAQPDAAFVVRAWACAREGYLADAKFNMPVPVHEVMGLEGAEWVRGQCQFSAGGGGAHAMPRHLFNDAGATRWLAIARHVAHPEARFLSVRML